ncbi:MAG TPA: plastocyanin/azurin family copper-binding protein [Gaiellaceae bacterium]|nr:plastocyanin/azurin family copper-binding protein [Gaiellaceae bacterium]
MKIIYAALAAAAVALSLSAAASPAVAPKLTGTVGPGFTITLKRGTAPVRALKAGFYNLTVADKASIHNFQIEGPGLDRAVTTVGFVGTKTVRLHFRRGTYKFYCKPHESSMFGNFKVT